jgi:hypothetical protein
MNPPSELSEEFLRHFLEEEEARRKKLEEERKVLVKGEQNKLEEIAAQAPKETEMKNYELGKVSNDNPYWKPKQVKLEEKEEKKSDMAVL